MRAGIALGSNLGNRADCVRRATAAILGLPGVSDPVEGPVVETAPVDCPPGAPPFLNTVLEVETSLAPGDLLGRLQEIETALGRPAGRERNASRPIDLDLLYAGEIILHTASLTLPHPRIATRRFVLEPLAAIRPRLILPGQRKTVAEMLASLEGAAAALRPMKTPEEFRAAKARGEKISALTAYDYPMGRLLDEAGVDLILVGDSLGMVVLGHPDTTEVTMDDMLHHTRAVARGVERALLVTDLPARSYATPAEALTNARHLLAAGAHAVKLEGGAAMRAQIKALTSNGIPVVAHIGMLPQSVRLEGGYKIKGRSAEEESALMADALAVEEAGAFAVVLEIIAPDAAQHLSETLAIPTIGIGSGAGCDGQILVTHDLVGLFPWFQPKFVSQRAHVADEIRAAAAAFVEETAGPAGAAARCLVNSRADR